MKKIQLKIESVNNKILSLYAKFLLKLLTIGNIRTKLVFLPKTIKRLTFLKSPHVFKKAKEHFEIRKYKVLIICNSSMNKLKTFLLNRPNTVRIKMVCEKRR
jgi:ribosomal protein S10